LPDFPNVVHDCGQIINPDGVKNQIESNIIQTISRTLWEELKFDRSRVTSVDWASYPILPSPRCRRAVGTGCAPLARDCSRI